MEINASMTYLAMGAHFAKDTVNRPGFSEFFFKAAAEEREHGMKLIEYLLMRGQLAKGEGEISKLITIKNPDKKVWVSAVEALKDALATEAKVTESIRRVITACEDDSGFNDYHVRRSLYCFCLALYQLVSNTHIPCVGAFLIYFANSSSTT